MIYWLKTSSDIAADGYGYNSNCFPIDTFSSAINLGSPERKYTVKKIIGNGASISGGDYYGDRKINISRRFKADGVSVTGALTSERQTFLSKFITLSEDLYLIRNYNGSLQYIKVYPVLNAEKYKKLLVSEDVDIELLCDIPFFHDSVLTETSSFTKDSRYYDYSFINPGVPAPVIFEGEFISSETEFKIGVYENYGAKVVHSFSAGDIIKIDSADLRVWVNNVERFGLITEGTPFNLLSGPTKIRIECVSNMSDCIIKYRGRHL